MKEIKLYKSKWKATKLIFGCGLFVVIGIYLLNKERVVGITSIVFFGLCLLIGLFQLFDRRPQIIINQIGIYDRNSIKEFINWEIIFDAYLINISNRKFICLVIDETYSPSKKRSTLYRKFVRINKEIGAQELNLFVDSIETDTNRLLEFIKLMITAEKNIRGNLLEKGI